METKRILLIDDDDGAIDTVQRALSMFSVNVEVVRDSVGAFSRVRDAAPDAVVLAVELQPQKQGYNLCRRLKKSSELRDIPILLTSIGDPYLEDHKKLATRADGYLIKPFPPEELVEKLETLLGEMLSRPDGEFPMVEEETHVGDATMVVELVETIDDADIVADVPEAHPPPPVRKSAPSESILPSDDDFDAMLDSLQFDNELRPAQVRIEEVDLDVDVDVDVDLEALAAPVQTPAPTRPNEGSGAWRAVDAADPILVQEEVSRTSELRALRDKLAFAEHQGRERNDRLVALAQELTELRAKLTTIEGRAGTKEHDLAEEIAARDQEIEERQARLEQFASESAQVLEKREAEHATALKKLRAELASEHTAFEQQAERDRTALETMLQQRLRDSDFQHERSLSEAREEATRAREALAEIERHKAALAAALQKKEAEHKSDAAAIEERATASLDEARRSFQEELGRRAEEHAHELGELTRHKAALAAALQKKEAEHKSDAAAIEERATTSLDEARRSFQEELGRRAEEHAHELGELKRKVAQELEAVELRSRRAGEEAKRLVEELAERTTALGEARARLEAVTRERDESRAAAQARIETITRERDESRATAQARIEALTRERDESREAAQAAERTRDETRAVLRIAERDREGLRAAQQAAERDRDEARAATQAIQRERDALRAALQAAERERDEARAATLAIQRDRDALHAALQATERERDEARAATLAIQRDRDALHAALQATERERDEARAAGEQAKKTIVALERAFDDAKAAGDEARGALRVAEMERDMARTELAAEKAELTDTLTEMSRLGDVLRDAQERARNAETQTETQAEARAKAEERASELEAKFRTAEDRLAKALLRLKLEEKRREKLKKTSEVLIQLLEDRSET